MAVKEIVKWPSLALRTDTHSLDPTSGETARIYKDLADTMAKANGAGLAAPQIGEPAKIFLIANWIVEAEDGLPMIFVNPEVTWLGEDTMVEQEGCLSFPDIWLNVRRHLRCKVKAEDLDGKVFEVEAKGLYGFHRQDLRQAVPLGTSHEIALGSAAVRRQGEDLTVITYGAMVWSA